MPHRWPWPEADIGPEVHRHGGVEEGLALLVWRFPRPMLAVSSAPLGGGLGLRAWVVNAQVPPTYARHDPDAHLSALASDLALGGRGVGMLTAVDVRSVARAEDGGARADVSVGITVPTWAAAPDGVDTDPTGARGEARRDAPAAPGTVNIVGLVPERLSPAALVNAVMTVTEAKSQALWDAGVRATGTASDAVCLACPDAGREHSFGGPRSVWGARLARAVHRAVTAGLSPSAPGPSAPGPAAPGPSALGPSAP